jgi:hypothetical protein
MDIKELKVALERIESLYAAAGATAVAKDIKSVARLLDGHDSQSVEAFIQETRALLERPAGSAAVSVDIERANNLANRLLLAALDQKYFETVLAEMDSDKSLGKPEWVTIANRYLNAPTDAEHVYKFKSIKECRSAVRDAFIERQEAQSKRGILERMTRWAS